MNQLSLRASPGGSTAFSCHCSSRMVLVKVPSFSADAAAGMRITSVPMVEGSAPGAFDQKLAVSVSKRSRTTIQSSLFSASRTSVELAFPAAGFWPSTRYPFSLPESMSAKAACSV
jgi:hypothetical protein